MQIGPTYEELEKRNRQLAEEVFSLKQTMRECRNENLRHKMALDAVNEGLWDWNLETNQVYFTPRYYTMLGYEPYEMTPGFETWLQLLHPDDTESAIRKLRDYLSGKEQTFETEFRMQTKSGNWKWILGRGKVIECDDKGRPIRLIGTHADIHQRKTDEFRTAHLNGVLQAIREVSQLILREKDREKLIRGVCDILVRVCGYRNVRIILMKDRCVPLIWAESGMNSHFERFVKALKQGIPIPCIGMAKNRAGAVFVSHPSAFCADCPLRDTEGENTVTMPLRYGEKDFGILSFSLPGIFIPDDTEQELVVNIAGDIAFCLYSLELEKQREETENELRKYEIIVSAVRDPMFFIDRNYVFQSVNRAYLDFFRKTREEVAGRSLPEILGDEVFENRYKEQIDRCLSGKSIRYQERMAVAGGEERYLDISYYPYKEEDGSVSGIIMSTRDISSLKETEASLISRTYELGERVKELNCLIGISVIMEKPDTSIEEIFSSIIGLLCAAFQYPEIACAGIRLADGRIFASENFAETQWKLSNEIVAAGSHFGRIEVYYREQAPLIGDSPFAAEEKMLVHSVAERLGKVLEHRQADASLMESEKRFRDLVENSPVGICIIRNHRIIYENPEQKRLCLFGNFTGFPTFDNLYPDDMEKIREFYREIVSGKRDNAETDFRFYPFNTGNSRPELTWVNCRMSRIQFQGEDAVLFNMIDTTRTREMENLLSIRDKMSSLGRVAAGIAHEIRNPLSGINIYLDTLEQMADASDDPEKMGSIVRKIQSASDKIESIIKRVMDFSKPGDPRFAHIDIRQPAGEAMQLSSVSLRKSGIELRRNIADSPVFCYADAHMIERVILNLINNAADAMRDPHIEKKILEIAVIRKGNEANICVSDSGPGIPADAVRKIFDPFFSTKNYGTGIGLSLCHRIVTDHGGFLDVSVSPLGGAGFTVRLPVKEEKI
ncbi:MAG: PAS domain S-box protein [Desulfococcaceae bacterium]